MIKLLTPNLLELKNVMNSRKLWLISSNLRPKNIKKKSDKKPQEKYFKKLNNTVKKCKKKRKIGKVKKKC